MVEGLVAAFARRARRRARRLDRRATSRFRARWSTASCPATTDADVAEADAAARRRTTPRRSSPSRSAQWVIEDRFAAPRPAVGGRRRAVRRRCRAVRDDEAAAAQRQPLDARVPGLPRWGTTSSGRRRPIRCSARADRAADGRGDRADARRAARHRSRRVLRAADRSASAIPRCRTGRGRSRWTARRSCRSACSATVRDRIATGATDRAPRARGRRLDPLRERHRRAGHAPSTSPTRWPRHSRRSRATRAATPGAIADGFLDLEAVFGDDLVAHYAFREAVRGNVDRAVSRRRAGDASAASGSQLTSAAAKSTSRNRHGHTDEPASRPAVPRRPRHARPRAPAVRDGQGPADREPARPHRSAVVRRRRAVRRTRPRCSSRRTTTCSACCTARA